MNQCDIQNPFDNAPVYYVDETDSTMDDLRRMWRDERRSGAVLATGFQRAGRGRVAARRWVCPPGTGLLFSLVLAAGEVGRAASDTPGAADPRTRNVTAGAAEPEIDGIPSDLPLRVGCAVAVFLRGLGLEAAVKWPNDVLVTGRKIAGILVETAPGGAIIGIGLNCNQTAFPEEIRARATSIRQQTGRFAEPLTLLPGLLLELRRSLAESGPSQISWLLYGVGKEVVVRVGDSTLFGCLVGIAPTGGLVIRTNTGLRTISSGEIARIG